MRRWKFRTFGVSAALGLALALSACGGSAPEAPGSSGEGGNSAKADLKIGAIYLDTQGFYAGVKKGVELGAEDAGRTVTFVETNAAADASKESAFIDTLISSQVDAILLSAVSADASVAAIRNAADAGIPVVCYNTCINEESSEQYVKAYAYGDPVAFGYATGEAAADFLDSQQVTTARIGVLNCEFVEVCVNRREGFEQALDDRGIDYEIVANQEATDPNESIGIAENMLTADPTIDMFYGESGGATLGGLKAVENKGMVGEVYVFGSDMTTELAEALQRHDVLKASIDVSGIAVGRAAIGAAMAVIDGESVDFVVEVPIDVYSTPEQGADWLSAHPDGIP